MRALRAKIAEMQRADDRLSPEEVHADASLISDIGLDSISMVELACALEEELGLVELPLTEWLGRESDKPGKRYTVAAFVEFARSAGAPTKGG